MTGDRARIKHNMGMLCWTIFSLFVLYLAIGVGAPNNCLGAQKRIELVDGTVLYGELVYVGKDHWEVLSDTLGTVDLAPDQIKSIEPVEAEPTDHGAAPSDFNDQVRHMTNRMKSDPGIMEIIQSLQHDPDFERVMRDPAIIKAIQEGDLNSLLNNPDFLKLLNHPKVQQIYRKMGPGQ